jgi:hypothetical protein
MTRAANLACHAMHLALLRGASLMVPFARRSEWYQEWTSELWHVRRSCVPVGAFSWTAERELTAFCMGSIQDAACLRRQDWVMAMPSASVHGSARQCVLWMCTVVALCAMVAKFLPGIQSEKDAAMVQLRPGVILIQKGSYGDEAWPTIPYGEYRDWESRRQQFFTNLAFYRAERERAEVDGIERGAWVVAHASENLFSVLGVELPKDAGGAEASVPRAMLSRALWRRAFQSDPAVIGQVVTVGNHRVRIAGIAPAGTWRLPAHPDIWILEERAKLARVSGVAPGYVIGLLSPLGRAEMTGDVISIFATGEDGDTVEFRGTTFAPQTGGPWAIYIFALILAVLALPAITSVFKSESSFASHPPSLRTRAKRWAFLAAKIVLTVAVGYFGALDIAYWNFADYSPSAEFLQFAATFCICLFGLRWALMDQSRRCPVCLRRVTHPAQVGIASCNFLGWNGTEMICMGGHALLHVPSLPTSWFGRQRWMYLDTSWDFLFADTTN